MTEIIHEDEAELIIQEMLDSGSYSNLDILLMWDEWRVIAEETNE